MERERRDYSAYGYRGDFGRASIKIICPFCGAHTKAYIWSLSGGGKKCTCGALHTSMGKTLAPIPKNKSNESK